MPRYLYGPCDLPSARGERHPREELVLEEIALDVPDERAGRRREWGERREQHANRSADTLPQSIRPRRDQRVDDLRGPATNNHGRIGGLPDHQAVTGVEHMVGGPHAPRPIVRAGEPRIVKNHSLGGLVPGDSGTQTTQKVTGPACGPGVECPGHDVNDDRWFRQRPVGGERLRIPRQP